MFDLARKATDYQWQALKHGEQALGPRMLISRMGSQHSLRCARPGQRS